MKITPFGVQAISLAHAYGLSVLASVFMSTRGLVEQEATTTLIQGAMLNVLALIFGFIAVQFM